MIEIERLRYCGATYLAILWAAPAPPNMPQPAASKARHHHPQCHQATSNARGSTLEFRFQIEV